MPLDAITLRALTEELRPQLLNLRIDKVQQPARDQVILLLRGNKRLLLNAGANAPRLQLTELLRDNPAEPPMFCMLLRKHLVGARVADITQPGLERLVRIELDVTDDFGQPGHRTLVLEASIKKYTGEVQISFAENVRQFLTQYYQLIPDWMGQLSENAYRMAFYLYYRARKAPVDDGGNFLVRVEDIINYIGLPTKEEVKNRNYDEAIIRPFNRAVEEIEDISGGSLQMSFDYDNINSFLAGKMTVGIDETIQGYRHKIETRRQAKQLETGKKRASRKKKADNSADKPTEG